MSNFLNHGFRGHEKRSKFFQRNVLDLDRFVLLGHLGVDASLERFTECPAAKHFMRGILSRSVTGPLAPVVT